MTRDEKGRFAPTVEMTDEQREAICYKSKLLNKYFDNYEDMVDAENAYRKEHEAELRAKEERKAEAEKVKTAVKERVEAELAARKAKAEAYKVYCAAIDEANKMVNDKKKVENDCLRDFCRKHPEGFHDTIQIGDITYRYDYGNTTPSYVDPFLKLFNWF